MAELPDFLRPDGGRREKPLEQAHFVERQFVRSQGSWEENATALAKAFPRETRPDRPHPWYQLLRGTHWPGDVPPGNGPFYVPEWVLDEVPEAGRAAFEAQLKALGFRSVTAHVVYLPPTGEYLAAAMRAAGALPWTANPHTYRAYLYPSLKASKAPLRPYTTARLRG